MPSKLVISLIVGVQGIWEWLKNSYSQQSEIIQEVAIIAALLGLIAIIYQAIRWIRRKIESVTAERWEAVADSIRNTGLLYWKKPELPHRLKRVARWRQPRDLVYPTAAIPWLPEEKVACVNIGKEKAILGKIKKLDAGAGDWALDNESLGRFFTEAFPSEEVNEDIKAWFYKNPFHKNEKKQIIDKWIALMNLDKIDTARYYLLALHGKTSMNVVTYVAAYVVNRHTLPTRDIFYTYRPKKETLIELRCDGVWSIASDELPPIANPVKRDPVQIVEVPSSNEKAGPWRLFVIPITSPTGKGLLPNKQGFYEIIHSTIREVGKLKIFPEEDVRSIFENKGKFYLRYERRNLFRRPGFFVVNFCGGEEFGVKLLSTDFLYILPARKKLSDTEEAKEVITRFHKSLSENPSEFLSRQFFKILWQEVKKDKASVDIKRKRGRGPLICPKIPGWTILFGAIFEIDTGIARKMLRSNHCEEFRTKSWDQLKRFPAAPPMVDFLIPQDKRLERALNYRYTTNVEEEKVNYVVDSFHEKVKLRAEGVVESKQTWQVRSLCAEPEIKLPFFCSEPAEISYCTYNTRKMSDKEVRTFFSFMNYWRGYWIYPSKEDFRKFSFTVITKNIQKNIHKKCLRVWYLDRPYARFRIEWPDEQLQMFVVCGKVLFKPSQAITKNFQIPDHRNITIEPTDKNKFFEKMSIWGMGRGYELHKIR